jgi:hypothetical protein
MFVNTKREKLSKPRAQYNHFQFHPLFGGIFLWISLLAYLNHAINPSSWWSLIVFPNMLNYFLFNIHSLPPQWLKFSWIISSSFMACLIPLSLTEILLSSAIFGNNYSGYREPNCILEKHIISKLMGHLGANYHSATISSSQALWTMFFLRRRAC